MHILTYLESDNHKNHIQYSFYLSGQEYYYSTVHCIFEIILNAISAKITLAEKCRKLHKIFYLVYQIRFYLKSSRRSGRNTVRGEDIHPISCFCSPQKCKFSIQDSSAAVIDEILAQARSIRKLSILLFRLELFSPYFQFHNILKSRCTSP